MVVIYLARDVLSRPIDRSSDTSDLIPAVQSLSAEEQSLLFERMNLNGDRIYSGATAFLKRQYRTIAWMTIVGAGLLAVLLLFYGANEEKGIEAVDLAWRTGVSFLVGAFLSALSGVIGMIIAVKTNVRTASAATRSLGDALTIALRGGAVSGILIVGLSLLGVFGLFWAFGGFENPKHTPELIVGFGFGASFVALFAQLGGGIYTKAADVGADLVGKVEAGLPEDDPRNPAVIADLVGDNVGDCAGRGADLFESTAAESIGAMILGVAIFKATGENDVAWILFPLVVRAFGAIASIIGLLVIRPGRVSNAQRALDVGYWTTAVLSTVGMAIAAILMLGSWWFFWAGLIGIITSVLFVYITQYYTAFNRPVREIAEASRTGAATNIISGLAVGFENTAIPVVVISVALGTSFQAGIQAFNDLGISIGDSQWIAGVFGTAVATMGMLMSAAYILAMDTFGPIADNAGGVTEMAEAPGDVRDITDGLDAVGNTTKALTKGYAIASAALAAFLLFSAYLETAGLEEVNLAKVEVFIGAMLGGMLVFLFSSLAIRAVGRSAQTMILEVRRQWREQPGILEGKVEPDYAKAVDISTRSALREMIAPGLLAVLLPVAVGLILRAEAEAAMLMVGTIVGVLLATVMNNAGGAWDNAKKYIEAGHLRDADGNAIGKGTDEHAASVVGDTVGDPFKDTAGPSLHVLVKLLSTITLVLAPVFI
ncbi:MAG: sodium-translocating pyrophosphatase [Chloroflexi bacterium]|nr:sodium-translocating pyrophosphatase [Chloroflexota bacterium]HCU73602.1 sodium-translocating pyrophosphatase [Chloroflexota bacterium]